MRGVKIGKAEKQHILSDKIVFIFQLNNLMWVFKREKDL